MSNDPRIAIFVIGAGRTGTSCMTRLLSLCGAALPREILGAGIGNERGHWEPNAAIALNDTFLAQYRSNWYDPRIIDFGSYAQRAAFEAQIRAFLVSGFDSDGTIVIKDPRITGLLPFWLKAAVDCGFDPRIVHTVRHPTSMVRSIVTRDGIEDNHALALWLKYNFLGERDSRGHSRRFAAFETLVGDWVGTLQNVIDTLDLPLAITPETIAQGNAFVSRKLVHHTGGDLPGLGPDGWLEGVYRALQSACDDPAADTSHIAETGKVYLRTARFWFASLSSYQTGWMPPAAINQPAKLDSLRTNSDTPARYSAARR